MKSQLEEEKRKLDDEYQKMKEMNKELARQYKKEFEDERTKIETNLALIEKKIRG